MCFRPGMMTFDKKCPECGAEVGLTDEICPECGAEIPVGLAETIDSAPAAPAAPAAPNAPQAPSAQ